jgi:hypothetical protein
MTTRIRGIRFAPRPATVQPEAPRMDELSPEDDRERRLIEAVVSLAKTFREEREQLMRRLTQLEREIEILAIRLDEQTRPQPDAPPDGRRPGPSRIPS